ncbi:MAG: TetR/AcrR family transcriptional regulator [Acidimicrobiia bacterium]
MAASYKSSADEPGGTTGTPARQRELRAQGRQTMNRLLDAGLRVFAERGYHASRVDDVVRAAKASHGTFYLYFTNKEDLLRALAVDCAQELTRLAETIGPVTPDEAGRAELRAFLGRFLDTYRRYGPVIRAWMEDQVGDREVDRLGVKAFTAIGDNLGQRMREAGVDGEVSDEAAVGALMAMLERFSYALASRRVAMEDGVVLGTLSTIVHRGFFNG